MKKMFYLLLVSVFFFAFSATVFAATCPEFVVENGNTVLGTFKTDTLTGADKDFVKNWISSNRNLLVRSVSGVYYLLDFPEGTKFNVYRDGIESSRIVLMGNGIKGLVYDVRSSNGFFSNPLSYAPSSSSELYGVIVCGSIFDVENITLPMPVDYVAQYQGDLILRDNGGLFGSGSDTESGGIFDWLSSFWDSFLDFVKSIFIPENGYFEKWYQDIKTAADKKFSGVTTIFDTLNGGFGQLQNTSSESKGLVLTFPANHFFVGSPAMSANMFKGLQALISFVKTSLTAIVVVFTAIICYKRIVVLFEQ